MVGSVRTLIIFGFESYPGTSPSLKGVTESRTPGAKADSPTTEAISDIPFRLCPVAASTRKETRKAVPMRAPFRRLFQPSRCDWSQDKFSTNAPLCFVDICGTMAQRVDAELHAPILDQRPHLPRARRDLLLSSTLDVVDVCQG
jgi:hypothetical protein